MGMSKLDAVLDAVIFLMLEFRITRVIRRVKSRITTVNLQAAEFGFF